MIIPLKTRVEISAELGFNHVKTFLHHLAKKGIVLSKRDRLMPCEQKQIYEAFFYPDDCLKEWYEKY